jgi:hypothetical protein
MTGLRRSHVRFNQKRLSSRFLLLFQQAGNAIRYLRTLGYPMGNAVSIKTQSLFSTGGAGIEKAQTFNETAVAFIAAIGHNDVIERAFFGAAT